MHSLVLTSVDRYGWNKPFVHLEIGQNTLESMECYNLTFVLFTEGYDSILPMVNRIMTPDVSTQ